MPTTTPLNELEQVILQKYEDLHTKASEALTDAWIPLRPAIPFVGSNYANPPLKVLVYGSAENLTYLWDEEKNDLKPSEEADALRNRRTFQRWLSREDRSFFPEIHMSPVKDGTLLTAARHLIETIAPEEASCFATDPYAFIEQIAVVNYGKYSLKGTRNTDYAGNPELLKCSESFVRADLDTLKPDIVILPRSIHLNAFRKVLQEPTHRPKHIWVIYQTNTGVINRHINKQLNAAGISEAQERSGWVEEWLKHIPNGIRMDRYLDWLDWRNSKLNDNKTPNWKIQAE